ncbi:hypothetical protein [Micromonospora globbae]|uniref:PucR family transcriptional regulator n=1 Tax=Micromonospora globbae TaxID=1894969 RepID=A0ABZ1S9V7_9ACTN|nr:hypothetical protein [Micromonospora globbae]
MNENVEAGLRARLGRLTGAARTRPLVELAQVLADRYWRAGPGKVEALPVLDEVIACLDEAYGYLSRDDPMRPQIGSQLGALLGARHTAHRSSDSDRQRAVTLLEEALEAPNVPPVLQSFARFNLGQLLLSTSVLGLQSADVSMLTGGGSLPGAPEAARAADCFRAVLAADVLGPEMAEAVQAMLTMAETMQKFLADAGHAGRGALDLEPLMRVMTTMHELQRRTGGGRGGGLLFDLRTTLAEDPLDRPVTVLRVPDPGPDDDPADLPRQDSRPTAPDVEALRRAIAERVAAGGDPFEALAALLRPEAPPAPVGLVDDLVGLATSVAHAVGADATPADRLVLAVARYLRGRDDADGGWVDADDDLRAAATELSTAADALPADPSGAVPLAVDLARLLDAREPAGRLLEVLRDGFAPAARALRDVRVPALAWPVAGGTLLLTAEGGRFTTVPRGGALPERLVVVGTRRPADRSPLVSHVSTARQLVTLAGRVPMRVTEAPVFVSDPRGDHGGAELLRLCRPLYRRPVVLGRADGVTDGPGSPAEVRQHLDASLLHLACGVDAAGGLELAGPDELAPATIADRAGPPSQGGLAILPPVAADTVPLTDALLAAGFTAVVRWVRPVPRAVATLMLAVLHTELVRGGLRPVVAVRAVGRWLRSPDRRLPATLAPTSIRVDDPELTDPAYRTAMVLHGL